MAEATETTTSTTKAPPSDSVSTVFGRVNAGVKVSLLGSASVLTGHSEPSASAPLDDDGAPEASFAYAWSSAQLTMGGGGGGMLVLTDPTSALNLVLASGALMAGRSYLFEANGSGERRRGVVPLFSSSRVR